MNDLTLLGDKYGSSTSGSYRIKCHYRPIVGYFSARFIVQSGVLDNVFSDMGAHGNDGFFQHFQLSYYKYQRKESA